MARVADRLPGNVAGEFFVDSSCIDCDTCRFVAPATFIDDGDVSVVARQPTTPAEQQRALMALVACPTSSIGTLSKLDARAASRAFPEPITNSVRYCGYAEESSFGASAYLITRAAGNVLVDVPRFARPLVERVAQLGGVSTIFLTHRDDVGEHSKWAARFGAARVLHQADLSQDTRAVEQQLTGDAELTLAADLTAIPVPGHTRGSVALLYRGPDTRVLFSGDHLWYSPDRQRLHASRGVCWYSWPEQRRSVERLLAYDFEWILPGHGRRHHTPTAQVMKAELGVLLAQM